MRMSRMSLERRRIARASGPAEAGTLWDLRHRPFQGTAAHRYHSLRPRSAGCLGAAYPYPDDVERTNVLIPTITRAPEAGPLGHSPAWGVVLVGHRATESPHAIWYGEGPVLRCLDPSHLAIVRNAFVYTCRDGKSAPRKSPVGKTTSCTTVVT